MRWLPRMDIGRWWRGDIDGHGHVEGFSICIQWGWLFLEYAFGRRET